LKGYKYIIIGGGMAGSAAAMKIRQNDSEGSIAMFSKEKYGPYNRPPLTKGLWGGKDVKDIMRPMAKHQVDLFLENVIEEISSEEHKVVDEKDNSYHYHKLLIATGSHPVQLPASPEGVIYYRTLEDFYNLKELTQSKSDFCVIGGGFIGSEITAALTKQGMNVTIIFPEAGISGLQFPDDLSQFLNGYFREKGVNVLEGHLVNAIIKDNDQYIVKVNKINDDRISKLRFDGVVVGIGVSPNVQIAESAGLEVNNGIIVNEFLQTNDPNIFAAGDVANFMNTGLGKRTRVEHEDNANTMGTLTGQNMSGEMEKYENIPIFYSDLFDLGYEAVGEMNKNLDIYKVWIKLFHKGTIFYHQNGKVRGLVFWNLWGKVDQGRDMIRSGKTFTTTDLKGYITE